MKLSLISETLRLMSITFVGFLTSLMVVILLSPILIVFWLYSAIVFMVIRVKLGNTFVRPGGLDIIQGMESKESRPYINAIGRYKGKVDVNKYRRKFHELITVVKDENGKPRFKKFTQVFEKVCGYHVFRDSKKFDMRNHVRRIELQELFPELFPEEAGSNKDSHDKKPQEGEIKGHGKWNRELPVDSGRYPKVPFESIINRLMSKYGSSPVDPGLPQWEILVVEEDEHYTMVFKMHHSYSDGVYFLRYYLRFMGDNPVQCNLPYNYHQPKWTRKFLDCFWAFCLLPLGLYRLSFNYEKNPLHGPKLSGDKMYMVSKPIELANLKRIKKESKTSMSAIFFTCLSNAMATHFRKKRSNVQIVIVLVPVSLQDLSRPIKMRNRFGLSGVIVPTFLEKDSTQTDARNPQSALSRLSEIQKWCNLTKKDPSFLAIHWLLVFICSLLPSRLLKNAFTTKGLTTSLSNLAGPSNENFSMMGCLKTDFCFFIPDRNPLGMGVSVAGFGGQVRIGLMVDRLLMETEEEGDDFLEAFRGEVTNLLNELHLKKTANDSDREEFGPMMIRDLP